MSLKEVHEPFPSNCREPIHEDRRLQIAELDEWQMRKPRPHDKPKLCQNELNTFPNQLKVGDKVLLDATDPHIATTKPNDEIPLTVLTFSHSLQSRHGHTHRRAYDRVETGQRFPNMGYEKSPRSCDMVPCHLHVEGKRALASSTLMMPTFCGVCHTGTSSILLISLPSDIGRGSFALAPMLLGWLDTSVPLHRSPRIILDPHWPDVSTRYLEHAKHKDDRKVTRNLPSSISSHLIYEGGGPRGHY
ncbi:hypothetical protein GOBAR_AA20533 [Gossypium barbadense]|uniref:Uncharacterized protein n=1 Tax=Gossypium barbadense TaxID=3634 RepID=A0A2P5X9W0_GOSBA|nr:hypothetical protein GOBAR_AA20533 [Gossypium barbadense]